MHKYSAFHRALHTWYTRHGRHDLPWRQTKDPYAIWISEVMLQQTQVATVRDRFYAPFLKRFPTLKALSRASLEEVLQQWQGMGYYRRARNLHAAAGQIRRMPKTVEELTQLPGIGRNTAHAIAAFAYDTPVAVLEANVKRVVARLFALAKPSDRELWQRAQELLDAAHPFDYNQAMMDLGSEICTPNAPQCPICPARTICKGISNPERYPTAKSRKKTPIRNQHIILARNTEGALHIQPRSGEFLHGLYQFIEITATTPRPKLKLKHQSLRHLGDFTHRYSHFELRANVWLAEGIRVRGHAWHSRTRINALPLSIAEHKALKLLDAHTKNTSKNT